MTKEAKLPKAKPKVRGRDEVSTDDALASFLFDLIRDHLPLGTVEKVITDMERLGPVRTRFSDGDLGNYAISLARRIHCLNVKAK